MDGVTESATVNSSTGQLSLTARVIDPCPSVRIIRRIRVVKKTQGRNRATYLSYVGIIQSLNFDPNRWGWRNGSGLLDYTTAIGRNLLSKHHRLQKPIFSKWSGHLPNTFNPDWKTIWHHTRPSKEATFMWSVWHNAVAVHSWRARIAPGIDTTCNCCDLGTEETPFHRFFACPKAQDAWDYAQSVIYHVQGNQPVTGPHPRLSFQQCVFGTSTPHRFRAHKTIWSSLRGATLWIVWIARNSQVFALHPWPLQLIQLTIWEALLDTGRTAQLTACTQARRRPLDRTTIWQKFDSIWLASPVIARRIGSSIAWNQEPPPMCIFQ